jgi:leader peptidase (prepilin peptidase)/N-methyltransferase
MTAVVFLFGLVIGSFLNVCIRRIPRDESVVLPASRCPVCQAPIKSYDNIPVLSWLLLGGRCRQCQARISALYPAVELLAGLLFLACYLVFGVTLEALKWGVFSALLIVLTITDVRERILPDKVNFTGLGMGLALSFFTRPVDGAALWLANRLFEFPPPRPVLSFTDALLGAGAGSSLLWVVAEGYFRLRGREGMGLGDVKMMAMAGSFLGLKRTLLTILAGSLLGSVIGLLLIALASKGRDYELPFGTFLGAGALLVVFFGTPALDWYQSLLVVR